MKLSTKNQLVALVKKFNKEDRGEETRYEVKVGKYGRNKYSIDIYYTKLIYSMDFYEIMEVCMADKLLVRPSVMDLKNGEHKNYIAIQ